MLVLIAALEGTVRPLEVLFPNNLALLVKQGRSSPAQDKALVLIALRVSTHLPLQYVQIVK